MKRSPVRVIELCVYVLIIILAVIWLFNGGKLYNPPDAIIPSPPIETTLPEETEPPIYVLPPKSEYQTGR